MFTNIFCDDNGQAVTQYDSFDDYLKVVDAFLDILLQNGMVSLSSSVGR